jgi:hypothetical protein
MLRSPGQQHTRSFNVGDLVLRLKQDDHRNLESPWDGPYIVREMIPVGSYRFQYFLKKTGVVQANPWNVAQLRCLLVFNDTSQTYL